MNFMDNNIKTILQELQAFLDGLGENEFEKFGFLIGAKVDTSEEFQNSNKIKIQYKNNISYTILQTPTKSALVIGKSRGSVLGFSVFNAHHTHLASFFHGKKIIEFHMLYICEKCRKNGYSKNFFEIMESIAKTFGDIDKLVLSVSLEHDKNSSTSLVELYQKRGFGKSHNCYKYIDINNTTQNNCLVIGQHPSTSTNCQLSGFLMCKNIKK